MQIIAINSGLDSFTLVDRITLVEAQVIRGVRTFNHAPVYLGLESLAQLGALHVRYLTDFQRHAFLLKVSRCLLPAQTELQGTYELSGNLNSRSDSAFFYGLKAVKGGRVQLEGECLFAKVDYDGHFKREILESHYRNLFSCLHNDTRED